VTNVSAGAPVDEISFDIRSLTTDADFRDCVALQRRTWGDAFDNVAPPSLLKVSQRLGGVAAGAFDADGTLMGFVFGMTGVENGAIVHWSDMLAVSPEARNHGIGRRLKQHQRRLVARIGATVIYWTFDPLVARNAHLNINVLGVRVVDYVPDMYGESASPLHRGIGTDRFIVAWPVNDNDLAARRAEIARASAQGNDTLRIEIPANIAELQMSDPAAAASWRERTRRAFQQAQVKGYSVQGFSIQRQATHGHYVLAR
jgi:chorismate synthase